MVTTELFAQDEQALRARVLKLERRVQLLVGIMRLLFVLVRLQTNRGLTCADCRVSTTAAAPNEPVPRSAGETL